MSNDYRYTLGTAAKKANVAKSTISAAIKKGELSVAERVGNGFRIDPAELDRWMGLRPAERSADAPTEQNETPNFAALDAQIDGLKALLAEKDRRISDLETDRDDWKKQAQTLALTDQSRREAVLKPRGGLFGWWGGRKVANQG